jgi:flagellar FliL protein
MADTEETIEDIEGTEEEETLAVGPQRRLFGPTMIRALLFIAVALVVIILSGTIAFVVARRVNRTPAMEKRSPELAEKRNPLESMTLSPFSINTNDVDEPHFLRLVVVLGYEKDASAEFKGELINRMVEFQDLIITIVGSKRFDQLNGEENRSRIKEEIKRQINSRLQNGEIEEVYFTEFTLT